RAEDRGLEYGADPLSGGRQCRRPRPIRPTRRRQGGPGRYHHGPAARWPHGRCSPQVVARTLRFAMWRKEKLICVMRAKGVAVVTEINRAGQGPEGEIGGCCPSQCKGSRYRTPQNHDII